MLMDLSDFLPQRMDHMKPVLPCEVNQFGEGWALNLTRYKLLNIAVNNVLYAKSSHINTRTCQLV